jgi:4-hydroxymandelate oxidase
MTEPSFYDKDTILMMIRMTKWICTACNIYVYDEDLGDPVTGIIAKTSPKNFPDSWRCPVCGATRDKLAEISELNYSEKMKVYDDFKKKQEEQKKVVLVAFDSPETNATFAQEYGKPLGLRGIGQGLSYLNNLKALAKYQLKTRLITKHEPPVLETSFLGRRVSMPILGAPVSGMSYVSDITEEEFAYCILQGCKLAETIGFTGNTSKSYDIHPAIKAIKRVEGHGVNIFKPQPQEVLIDLMAQSERENAIAVGVDIDGAGSVNFTLAGKPVFRKTVDDLKELKRSVKIPFIIKGVMCEEDALAAVEAGANVIAVSNHGGRVLDSTPGVADVLPRIVKVIRRTKRGKGITITADGGVRTGFDAMKLLALGADSVLVGRPLAREAIPKGVDGVKRVLEYFKTDLKKAMLMTSCNTVKDIDSRVLSIEV